MAPAASRSRSCRDTGKETVAGRADGKRSAPAGTPSGRFAILQAVNGAHMRTRLEAAKQHGFRTRDKRLSA